MIKDVTTIVVTAEHVLRCKLDTGGRRLLEILNDPHQDLFVVHDVEVLRKNRNVRGGAFSDATVRKSHVGLVLRTEATHEAPAKRQNARIAKLEHRAYAVVLGYDVTGTCHLRGAPDVRHVLQNELGRFFPMTHAAVVYGGSGEFNVELPLAMVNRDLVTLLHIEHEATRPRERAQTARSLIDQTTKDLLGEFYGSAVRRSSLI